MHRKKSVPSEKERVLKEYRCLYSSTAQKGDSANTTAGSLYLKRDVVEIFLF
jgi:hypothetical protein